MILSILLLTLLIWGATKREVIQPLAAQGSLPRPQSSGGGEFTFEHAQHLTPSQRTGIQNQIAENISKLQANQILSPNGAEPTVLGWPLKVADSSSATGYHAITNFVDHDAAFPDMLLDYACGDRSYDLASGYNHAGTDYFLWPFAWNKMDNDEIEVVAAADGVIVLKQDGNFDRSCTIGGIWNAIYVQHEDGSVAWYGHLKNGSLTAKDVGTAVSAGDYLGVVGSSGSSTIPHLHFELYDSSDALIDPYAGTCNALNQTSWWQTQRPYYDSAVNKMTTGTAAVDFGTCPDPESSNEALFFTPGDTIYFTTYYRDQLITQISTYTIYRPDGSVYTTWSHNSNADHYAASWWYWSYDLPADAPDGKWQFEVAFNGQIYSHDFYLVSPQTPEATPYTTFANDDLALYAYSGQNIALLVPDADLNHTAVVQLLTILDDAYRNYQQLTGHTPELLYSYNGLTAVAVVPTTCANSCANNGQTGVELSQPLFDTIYADLLNNATFAYEPFKALAFNFWWAEEQLEYSDIDNAGVVGEGMAHFLALNYLASSNIDPSPINGMPFATHKAAVEGLLDTYLADSALDWSNTLNIGQAPTNALNLAGSDFFAAFLFELEKRFGSGFITNLLAETGNRPEAQTTQEAVDNFIIAASYAIYQNLVPLFQDEWRWPISSAAILEIEGTFADPVYLPFITK